MVFYKAICIYGKLFSLAQRCKLISSHFATVLIDKTHNSKGVNEEVVFPARILSSRYLPIHDYVSFLEVLQDVGTLTSYYCCHVNY